jgi:hypothetical protein
LESGVGVSTKRGKMRIGALLPAGYLLPLLLVHSPAPLANRSFSVPATISDIAWLEGVWHGRIGQRDLEARYTGHDGGQILSVTKYWSGGKGAGFEFERFEERDGSVLLTPYPGGESSVSFQLTSLDLKSRRAVFENPAHDFPTKLSYQRVAQDSLTILVSGPGKDGKETVERFVLARH